MVTPDEILSQIKRYAYIADRDENGLLRTIEICMEASVSTEEGSAVKFSLVWDPGSFFPSNNKVFNSSFVLKNSAPLESRLVKIAQASKPGGPFLVVQPSESGTPNIRGVTRLFASFGMPYSLLLSHRFSETESEQADRLIAISCLGPLHFTIRNKSEELVYVRGGTVQPAAWSHFVSIHESYPIWHNAPGEVIQRRCAVLNSIVKGMWHAGRGGTLAICGPDEPLTVLGEPGSELEPPIRPRQKLCEWLEKKDSDTEINYKSCIADVVRLSGIDGALALDNDIQVHGFGYKIQANHEEIECHEILPDNEVPDNLLKNQGTRHKSAANWVSAATSRIAIVVSQAKKISVFVRRNGSLVRFPYRPDLFAWPWPTVAT